MSSMHDDAVFEKSMWYNLAKKIAIENNNQA